MQVSARTQAGAASDAGRRAHAPTATRVIRVLDLINTDKSARELLDNRVRRVNAHEGFRNDIYCGPGDYVDRLRASGHTVHVVDQPRGLSPVPLMRAAWQTYRLLRRERYDVIHTHGSVIGVIGRMAAFFAGTRFVVHQVHGFHHHPEMGKLKRTVFIWIEKILGWFTDRLVFQNKADIAECLRVRIAPRRKLVLIGNGVQLAHYAPGPEPANNPPIILNVSRFEPVKNHPMILRAARALLDRRVAFRLLLVGDGECRAACEEWAGAHALTEHVEFLGYRDDVPQLTRNAEVCTLVSVKEGLPRALIEGQAAGRPVVASNVVGNRDTVIDGQTGFLVPLDDAEAMADRLEQLLGDAALRKTMGAAAAAHARAQFNEDDVTDRIITLYQEGWQQSRMDRPGA